MVRLKLQKVKKIKFFIKSLNSTMVRLKHNNAMNVEDTEDVSIPLWFD